MTLELAAWALVVGCSLLVGATLAAAVTTRSHLRRLDRALGTSSPDLPVALQRVAVLAEANGVEAARSELEEVLNAFSHGVLLYDDSGRVTFANRAGHRYVDARHSLALVAAAVEELFEPATPDGRVEHRLELAGPPRQSFDIAVLARDERGFVVTVEDITPRRRLEEIRRDFVANISHELKTPVGAMALLAETMTGEDDPALVSRLSGRLHHEAMRVGRTIEDLLMLSRIEGDDELNYGPVEVHEVIVEALGRVATAAEERDIALEVRAPADGLQVLGDARQLTSALYNLVDNALNYSEEGSIVAVRAAAVADDQVELEVEDHGIGIPARDVTRVFERFYRVDKGRSRRTGGTGLGLAIVRHVAENHGGEVHVRSREGEGSTFTLVLPRDRAAGAGGPNGDDRSATGPRAVPMTAVPTTVSTNGPKAVSTTASTTEG